MRERGGALLSVLAAVTLALGGCGGSGGGGGVALDGTPRVPDAEGVVQSVSRERLVLADGSTFEVGDELQSFSTYDVSEAPLLGREGQYVQVGLDGDRVVWIAGIGVVVPGSPDAVYYTGRLVEIDGEALVFRDGTVLTAGEDLAGLDDLVGGDVQAVIDPADRVVVELVAT